MDDATRIRHYVAMNGGDTTGYRAPDGVRFGFRVWNAAMCGLTARQRRRVYKKHRRAVWSPRHDEVPF